MRASHIFTLSTAELIIKPQSLQYLVYFHNEVQDDSQSCNYMEMHGPSHSIRHHRSSWARCSTITFIKIILVWEIHHRCTKIRRSLVCVVGPNVMCWAQGRGLLQGKWPLPQHSCSFYPHMSEQLQLMATWGYYTHLKSEGQLGTMHNVSGEPWRQVAIKASRGKTKLHATNLGY
jgi:hypothetical protein